jgi:hypothetical protein
MKILQHRVSQGMKAAPVTEVDAFIETFVVGSLMIFLKSTYLSAQVKVQLKRAGHDLQIHYWKTLQL